jgi:hypothetical protein
VDHDCLPVRCTDHPTGRVEYIVAFSEVEGSSEAVYANDSCVLPRRFTVTGGRRLRQTAVERLVDQLSDRDRAIVSDLARVRVLTGRQLTRLHFAGLSPDSRDRTRRRVLARLAELGVVTTLTRRIGGVRAGSAGLVFSLDTGGQRLLPLLGDGAQPDRPRRPWTPGALFLAHTLDVSELYVGLREQERMQQCALVGYATEPATWWPNGFGGIIKPDAYIQLRTDKVDDTIWCEVDRSTESLPTVRRKLLAYVDFANTGQLGPDRVVPRVLVTVPHERRLTGVLDLIASLPEPAAALIQAVRSEQAATHLVATLRI